MSAHGTAARVRALATALSLCGCYASHPGAAGQRDGGGDARNDAVANPPASARDAAATEQPRDAAPRDAAAAQQEQPGPLDGSATPQDAATSPPDAGSNLSARSTEPSLRVAFLGDQGLGPNAVRVLELIRDEGAALVLHQGDFDYIDDPAAWEAQLDAVLGADFPYFASVGNHDLPAWDGAGGYQARLEARVSRVAGAECEGRMGVSAHCTYRGLFFVLSGVGTLGENLEPALDVTLAQSERLFKLCTWHKNQHDMQVGAKADEVGWAPYQICERHGALIVTGHEHSYSRTRTLMAVGNLDFGHGAMPPDDRIELAPGRTAVVVAGLGGRSRRAFLEASHADDTWWASIYARGLQVNNGVQLGNESAIDDGALFIDFHVDGDPTLARGYFKTTAGAIVDSFTLIVAPR